MNITTKTTKKELATFIKDNASSSAIKKNKKLTEVVKRAIKAIDTDLKAVKRNDMVSLVKLMNEAMVPVANEKKPTTKKSVAKKSATKTEKKTEDKPKKSKKTKKDTYVEDNTIGMIAEFPETIEVEGTTYEIAHDIKKMDDLYDALDSEQNLLFGYYWTKRHLQQFPYFNTWLGQPKSFANDLDLATAIYMSEEKKVCYQISNYTEALYTIIPSDLKEVDGIRFSNGIEFQIYREVTE